MKRMITAVFIVGLTASCDQGNVIVDSGGTLIRSAPGWGLDSFRGDGHIFVRWNFVDPPFMPSPDPIRPTPIATVRLFISEEGSDQGYRPVFQEYRKRSDSYLVTGLTNGRLYYFRAEGFDSSGNKISTSHPIMTSPGRVDQIVASFPANQFEDPQWLSTLDWSPTRRRLAYIASTSNQLSPDIFILDLDTGENRRITHFAGTNSNHRLLGVSWSPKGDAIAYCYTPSRTFAEIDYAIWTRSLNGDQPDHVTKGRIDFDPLWASDGEIVFCRGTYEPPNIPEIWKVDLTTGNEFRLTSDQAYRKYNPTISPQGHKLAFRGSPLSGGGSSIYLFGSWQHSVG